MLIIIVLHQVGRCSETQVLVGDQSVKLLNTHNIMEEFGSTTDISNIEKTQHVILKPSGEYSESFCVDRDTQCLIPALHITAIVRS